MQESRSTPKPIIVFGLMTLLLAAAIGAFALWSIRSGPAGSGVALVGGPFSMVNQNGELVTEKSYAGKPMLLFFGFTYCPDVCPTELQVMAAALAELGAKGKNIQPILVTVDPARDTPDVLKAYLSNFGDRFSGLTGTPEQVAAMAKAYRVFYARQDNKDDPANYLVDHSSIIYLMGPNGRFLKHFTYTTDAKALAVGISQALSLH